MTGVRRPALAAFFAFLPAAASAQERVHSDPERGRTIRVTIGGGLELEGVFRDHGLEAARGTGARDTTAIEGVARLQFDAEMEPSARLSFTIENRRIESGVNLGALGTDPEGFEFLVREAWIELGGFVDSRMTARAGAMPARFDATGRGRSLFFDPSRSASIAANAAGAVPPGGYASATDRDTPMPAGAGLVYATETLRVKAVALPAVIEGGSALDDEAAHGAWLTTSGEGGRASTIGLVSSSAFGSGSFFSLFTIGGGGAWEGLLDGRLDLFGEAYLQGGSIGSLGGEEVEVRAWALEAGARGALPRHAWRPWFQILVDAVGGDGDSVPSASARRFKPAAAHSRR